MEIKFQSTNLRSLRCCTDRRQTQEQTQEVRLSDGMPDIGRILGAWGKPVIRGKEWQNGGMSVSGGVMVWIVYAPEDGSEPRTVESWIPFQMKWDFPQTQHDGYIFAVPALKSLDARSTSARKMMVRANFSIWGRGMIMEDTEVFSGNDVPEDVQLLQSDYPMELPMEAGEVMVHMDESCSLADIHPLPEKILRQDLTAFITEQRVMASRLVFRGKGTLHLLYMADGKVCSTDRDISFSQFADLDGEFSQAATAQIQPVVTNFELDRTESDLQIKCDLAAQYVIFDRAMVRLTEDAYSNLRPITLENAQLQLPRLLDRRTEVVHLDQTIAMEADKIVDISCLYDLPRCQQNSENSELLIPGQLQVLYYDPEGRLQSSLSRFEYMLPLLTDGDVAVAGIICGSELPRVMVSGQQVDVSWEASVDTTAYIQDGQWMVTGMELGELRAADPGRPSVIVCRFDRARLWDTAKDCGSTVDAIRKANGLDTEPEQGRMLLIPVS